MLQLVRKISAKTVYGGKGEILAKVIADKEKEIHLFRVVGICNGVRNGETDEYGPWQALLGAFEATNLESGEVFRSGVCFIPQYVTDLVTGQLGGDVERVKMAFDITAKYDEASATSYVYGARPLMPTSPDDPLLALNAELKALNAPEPAKTPVAETGKKK